jgi:hypothetical protein
MKSAHRHLYATAMEGYKLTYSAKVFAGASAMFWAAILKGPLGS